MERSALGGREGGRGSCSAERWGDEERFWEGSGRMGSLDRTGKAMRVAAMGSGHLGEWGYSGAPCVEKYRMSKRLITGDGALG